MPPEKGLNFFKSLIQLIKHKDVAQTPESDRASRKANEYFQKTTDVETAAERAKRLMDKLKNRDPNADEESDED